MWHNSNFTNYTDNFDLNITNNSSDLNEGGLELGTLMLLIGVVLFVLYLFHGFG